MDDPEIGVDLFLRRGAPPVVEGSSPRLDELAIAPGGLKSVGIGRESTIPLQPGTYFLALGVRTTGRAGRGVLTASVRSETFRGVELRDGQGVGFLFIPRPSVSLWGGDFQYVVEVPEGPTELVIGSAFNENVDVDLHVRFGQEVGLEGGRAIDDHSSTARTTGGVEQVVVTPNSNPPLRAGLYFIAMGVVKRNQAAGGLIRAVITCPNSSCSAGGGSGGTNGGDDLGSPTTVSAASFEGGAAALESIVSSFAAGITTGASEVSNALPLPKTLGGTTIQIIDSAGREGFAEFFFAGPRQANWLVPDWVTRGPARVIFRRQDGQTQETRLEIVDVAPGLFSADSTGQGAPAAIVLFIAPDGSRRTQRAFDCDNSGCSTVPIDLSDRQVQVFLMLFGTGFRRASRVTASVSGVDIPVQGFAAQGQFAGLDQANIRLFGDQIPDGMQTLSITADNKTSNVLMLEIRGDVPPPPPPRPTLTSLSTTAVQQGQTISNFALNGSNLRPVTEVRINPPEDITVASLQATDSRVITDLTVASNAATGERLVSVVSPGGESNALQLTVEQRVGSPPRLSVNTAVTFDEFNADGVVTRVFILLGLSFSDPDSDVVWAGTPDGSAFVSVSPSTRACEFTATGPEIGGPQRSGSITIEVDVPGTRRQGSTIVALVDAAGDKSNEVVLNGSSPICAGS